MSMGSRIREARKRAGMTQQELAQKLGISYVGVSQWERDIRNPKYETLKKIADALNISVDSLITEEKSKNALSHDFIKQQLGKLIRESREKMGLSEQALADKVGISLVTLQKYELGILYPLEDEMDKIVSVLNIDLSAPITLSPDPLRFLITPDRATLLSDEDLLTSNEVELLRYCAILNQEGQDKLIDYAGILIRIDQYVEDQYKPKED